ncbi:unnamed protein product [Ilex paraguariensis]|uniref:FHA domain-containing protein n=1 Tax=Ilex paraguariensis TaxID=185542 RepID=A0ABC8QUJ1_9AQUA
MVWGLFPADPLSGEEKYYFLSKGTYGVGRKGCDVIINRDKGVSRIHAEIVIDAMISVDHSKKNSSRISSKVRLRDCSKYGTFVDRDAGSKEKVHEFPNKEITLIDGDVVSFGTGNATYRFCFVPLIFFVCSWEPLQANKLLQDEISSIGACTSRNWSLECTHVLVDDSMPLKEDLFDAIMCKKPFARYSWVEFIAETRICTEIPSCSAYAPTMMLEGVSIKVADPKSRENCLRGYTFLLEPTHKYKYRGNLQLLLEVCGAKVVSMEEFCTSSQGLEGEGKNHVVVIPAGMANSSECFCNLSSLARVKEIDLVSAAVSGNLVPSVMILSPVIVTSSCSTDETVVADSDAEMETATSIHTSTAIHIIESAEQNNEGKMAVHTEHDSKGGTVVHSLESTKHDIKENIAVHTIESGEIETKGEIPTNYAAENRLESGKDRSDEVMVRRDKVDEFDSGNLDIIYSQDLIVRDTNAPASVHSPTNNAVLNFKCFRKTRTESGNSFDNLIPFSKYPYKDSDYGSEEVLESVKEEKKRKQMEAVAEDLFNSEKGRRRGVAGSLRGLFAHG